MTIEEFRSAVFNSLMRLFEDKEKLHEYIFSLDSKAEPLFSFYLQLRYRVYEDGLYVSEEYFEQLAKVLKYLLKDNTTTEELDRIINLYPPWRNPFVPEDANTWYAFDDTLKLLFELRTQIYSANYANNSGPTKTQA